MTLDGYSDLLRKLPVRSPQPGIRWDLDRTGRVLAEAGDPHRSFRSIHIAGTNGKGSVAATIAAVLRRAGLRTGLYTSPHLCTLRERVRIDGRPAPPEAWADAARRMWPSIEREAASFFEATTAIAFRILADARVDVAVIEVGLGGRLDATNVISPELAVITNIELDHAEHLGSTLGAVAREKAGIIKPTVPVVIGEGRAEIRRVLRDHATRVDAKIHTIEPRSMRGVSVSLAGTRLRLRTDGWGELDLATPLAGRHQARNTGLAVRALSLLPADLRPPVEAVVDGIAEVEWPGRFQVEWIGGGPWILDVAHNPAGARALARALAETEAPRPVVAVAAVLADKDWRGILHALGERVDAFVLTRAPTAPPDRRWDPSVAVAALDPGRAEVIPELCEALRRAAGLATAGGRGVGSVVVTGSFHTVGDALNMLGRAPFGADAPLPPCRFPA